MESCIHVTIRENADIKQYYDIIPIDATNALYRIIVGKRSNGKTYSVLKKSLETFIKQGYSHCALRYIRRWDTDLINCKFLYNPFKEIIQEMTEGRYNDIHYYSRAFYLVNRGDDGKIIEKSVAFCTLHCLNTWEHSKGSDLGYSDYICFDEFITRNLYLTDEFVIFTNLISSLIRDISGTVIYMLANTVNKYSCPYIEEMCLTNFKKMKQGEIDLYDFGNGTTVAVEWAPDTSNTDVVSKYFNFENPHLMMITGGAWEFNLYPHLPSYKAKGNVMRKFYIDHDGEHITGEILKNDGVLYLFVHPNTKFKGHNKSDIVYTLDVFGSMLWCKNLSITPTKYHEIINRCFKEGRVYYSDNMTGEIIRTWLLSQGFTNVK